MFVSTTALNCMARYPAEVAHSRTYVASARPTPRPWWAGSTMKLAVATCEPRPGRLGPILAEPSTVPSGPSVPSATATTVRPGGGSIHHGRAVSSVRSSGNA